MNDLLSTVQYRNTTPNASGCICRASGLVQIPLPPVYVPPCRKDYFSNHARDFVALANKDFNGVKFPTKILQTQGEFPAWNLTISSVQPNPAADLPIPDAVQSASIPPVKVETTKLADGVWFLAGGSHHSLVVALLYAAWGKQPESAGYLQPSVSPVRR